MAVSNMQARRMPNAPGAAAVDARDADGRTALMLAVLQGRLDAVVDLLRRGADPNAADTAGVTPLEAARAQQRPEIVDALLHAGAR
jgi:ankyrin repeat protein